MGLFRIFHPDVQPRAEFLDRIRKISWFATDIPKEFTTTKHHLVVDWDSVWPKLQEDGFSASPDPAAQLLRQLALAIGGELYPKALVHYRDRASITAFEQSGFRVWQVNGNRHLALEELEEEMESHVLTTSSQPLLVTLVTSDPSLERLARWFSLRHFTVRVWGPASGALDELRKPEYNFRPLEDLLPDLRVRKVVVLIDWENIAISLTQAGWVVNPGSLAQALKQQASQYGKVCAVYAYADWGALAKSQGQDMQRLLEMDGITTRYEISMYGKSSSDMRIIDKAYKLLQDTESPDVLILATGDRDFRALIETAQRCFGKTVVLWGKKGNVNPMVSTIADKVEWVDDFLSLPRQQDLDNISRHWRQAEEPLVDPLAELSLKVEGLLHSRGWKWVSLGKLVQFLSDSRSDTYTRSDAQGQIRQAKAARVLFSEQKRNPRPDAVRSTVEALCPNPGHPSVKAVRLIVERVYSQVHHALEVRRMPYVTFSYVVDGMEMDTDLKKAGLARTRSEQVRWLELLVEARLLIAERRTTPHRCTVLWLPERGSQI